MIRAVFRGIRRLAAKRRRRGAPIILMYHRVADLPVDPWALAVHPTRFDEQIDMLSQTRRVVHLHELLSKQIHRRSDKPLAAVTFDDGYYDVYCNARSVLHRYDCPATLFVTTGAIGSGREFWWDALAGIFLEKQELPRDCSVTIGATRRQWTIPTFADRTGRDRIYREVWSSLRTVPFEIRNRCLEQIANWADFSLTARPLHRAMTAQEVADTDDELVTIGTHTTNHPSLPELPFAMQFREIADSRKACEDIVNRAVTSFAYPFGDHDEETVRAVREAGLTLACTTIPDVVLRNADPLRLPRLNVGNWPADEFLRHIEGCPFS